MLGWDQVCLRICWACRRHVDVKEAGRPLLSLELTDLQEECGTDRDRKGQKHAHGIEDDGEASSVLVR